MADPAELIQATLAPIFLVNGAAIFLNFAQARLFRVIDRLRALPADDADRPRIIRRLLLLRNALLFGVLVIVFTVITTLLLLSSGALPALGGAWPIVSFAAALLSFFVALALVTADAYMSVAAATR